MVWIDELKLIEDWFFCFLYVQVEIVVCIVWILFVVIFVVFMGLILGVILILLLVYWEIQLLIVWIIRIMWVWVIDGFVLDFLEVDCKDGIGELVQIFNVLWYKLEDICRVEQEYIEWEWVQVQEMKLLLDFNEWLQFSIFIDDLCYG